MAGGILPETQPAGALRPHEGLVSGEAKQVDLLGHHVDGQDSPSGRRPQEDGPGHGRWPHPANIHGVSCEVEAWVQTMARVSGRSGPCRCTRKSARSRGRHEWPASQQDETESAPLRLQPVQISRPKSVVDPPRRSARNYARPSREDAGRELCSGRDQIGFSNPQMAMFRASVELAVNTTWSGRGQLKNVASFSLVP